MQPSKLAALEVDSTGGAPALPFGSCVQLELAHGMWQCWLGKLQSSCLHAHLALSPDVDVIQQPGFRCCMLKAAVKMDEPKSLSPCAEIDCILPSQTEAAKGRPELDLMGRSATFLRIATICDAEATLLAWTPPFTLTATSCISAALCHAGTAEAGLDASAVSSTGLAEPLQTSRGDPAASPDVGAPQSPNLSSISAASTAVLPSEATHGRTSSAGTTAGSNRPRPGSTPACAPASGAAPHQ